VFDLLAWADDDRLIGVGCAGTCGNEFRNALVPVSVDGRKVIRLSAYRETSASEKSRHPVLTPR